MLFNYFKVAIRAIMRNKLTSFINIAGLAMAIWCVTLIFFYVKDELSYDRYHKNADNIYRVTRDFLSPDGSLNLALCNIAPPFGPLLKNDFPEFNIVARTLNSRVLLAYEKDATEAKSFNMDNTFFAEPEIFDIFSINVTGGNAKTALNEPFKVMLSKKTAEKFFGEEQAIGKQLRANNALLVEVSGVFEDFPSQSHWHPDVLVSFSTLNDSTIYGKRRLETSFGNNAFGTYVLVDDNFDAPRMESMFPGFLDKHMGPLMSGNTLPSSFTSLHLQKLTDIHLHSHRADELEANGNITNIYMISVIGLFIVLIAIFNFVNLSTARATKRAKEVGMRKVAGAFRIQLITQFLSESIVIALSALVIASGLLWFGLDWLNAFTNKALQVTLSDWKLIVGLVVFTVGVGIIAGIYPAFIISSFKPSKILKSSQSSGTGKGMIRKVLVVAQFTISVALIIATAVTFQQLNYLNNRDLGYAKDQVVSLRYFGELAPQFDAFYNELTKHSAIGNLSRSTRIPTGRLLDSQGTAQIQKGDSMETSSLVMKNVRIDHEFFDTYGIQFVAGRNFSKEVKSDDSLGFILNEAAVRNLGVTHDEILTRDFQYGGVRGHVLGVVKDFHFESLHEEIIPVVFHASQFYNRISIKIEQQNMQAGLQHLEKVWKEFLPHRPFEYTFVSEQYADLYDSEQRQAQLFTIFSGLAIVIACLGLFGLATFNTLQRVKEIGIRKVLGASMHQILGLLSKEIMILIAIANLIAWPLAWYAMQNWLDGFAYRIDVNPLLFVSATVITLTIALLTVSSQTIKAALTNPANTLRHE